MSVPPGEQCLKWRQETQVRVSSAATLVSVLTLRRSRVLDRIEDPLAGRVRVSRSTPGT